LTQVEYEETDKFGLKEDWRKVEKTLEEIIPVYDRTNRFISLGTDLKIRNKGLSLLKGALELKGKLSHFRIVDLGAGPGKMTQLLLSSGNHIDFDLSIMVDALGPMMKVATSRNEKSDGVLSVYEHLALRQGTFDAAMAGFAIRDARDLHTALSEVSRILTDGGLFLIVDLSKPDSSVKRALVGFYWRAISPVLAVFAAGRLGLKFGALSTTYRRLPRKSDFLKLIAEAGLGVRVKEYLMVDGVCVILLEKSRR